MEASDLKMYIAVLDEVPDFMVPTLVAHSVLNAHSKFYYEPDYRDWYCESFKKVVLKVNKKEFNKISLMDKIHLGNENKTLGGKPSCIIACPRLEYPNVLKFAKMWSPKCG